MWGAAPWRRSPRRMTAQSGSLRRRSGSGRRRSWGALRPWQHRSFRYPRRRESSPTPTSWPPDTTDAKESTDVPEAKPEAKSLSGNRYLGEDELGAGEVNEPKVVLGFLLPAHQEPPGAVQPRMCSLHYPSPRSSTGVLAGLFALAPLVVVCGRDVGLVASGRKLFSHLLRVVGRIQAQVLPGGDLLFFRSGARYHDPVQGRHEQPGVVTVGPCDGHRQRDAGPVGEHATFGPHLGAIGGVVAGGFAARASP